MDKNKFLAYFALALVAYFPLPLYLFSVLTAENLSESCEIMNSGIPGFLGYFATAVLFRAWPAIILALGISIRGLIKKNQIVTNTLTLISCLTWFAAGIFIMVNFR